MFRILSGIARALEVIVGKWWWCLSRLSEIGFQVNFNAGHMEKFKPGGCLRI
jgi:hypothetical protein